MTKETEVLGEHPPPVPLCPLQIPFDMIWDRSWTAVVEASDFWVATPSSSVGGHEGFGGTREKSVAIGGIEPKPLGCPARSLVSKPTQQT
jgi:hypothetical protein